MRNTLRGLPSDDFDVATQLTPPEVIAALQAASIRAVPTGLEHGTITAVHESKPVEITTLRRDVETDGRRAVVAFTQDWTEDAARRDFRLNAIYAGADGTLFEVIEESIAEGLAKIAAERIWKELKRTLAAPDPAAAMRAMEDAGVLGAALPSANTSLLPGLVAAETDAGLAPDPMRRLMALVPRRLREAGDLCARLKVSNEESLRLAAWADPAVPHVLGAGEAAVAEAFYRFGAPAVLDRAVIEAASGAGGDLAALAASAAAWSRPKFPIGGSDALAAGLAGPDIGKALGALEEAWIASGFTLARAALVARLKAPG